MPLEVNLVRHEVITIGEIRIVNQRAPCVLLIDAPREMEIKRWRDGKPQQRNLEKAQQLTPEQQNRSK